MNRWIVILLTLLAAGPVLAQQAPPPAASPAAASPASAAPAAPAAVTPDITPSAEERDLLLKLDAIKRSPPKSPDEEKKVRGEYVALLREHMQRFPRSPRAYLVASALVQVLVRSNDVEGADRVAQSLSTRASTPEDAFWAAYLFVELYTTTQRPEKAISTIEAFLKAAHAGESNEYFTYKLAGLYAEMDLHARAIEILEAYLKANPMAAQSSRFRLRVVDLMLSANRPKDALAKLEAYSKASDDEEKALCTYFSGLAYLALSRDAAAAEADQLRKKALAFLEILMAGVRKDVRANQPFGAMAFSAAADVMLAGSDKAAAVKIYQEMKDLFKERPEGAYAERAIADTELIGKPLAAIKAPGLDGKPIAFQSFAGQIVLVTPWATWLDTSKLEAQLVTKLLRQHKGKPFAVVGICLNVQEDTAAVHAFAKDQKMTWPSLFDGKGSAGVAGQLFTQTGPPGNLVVDETGNVVRANVHGTHLRDVLALEIGRVSRKK